MPDSVANALLVVIRAIEIAGAGVLVVGFVYGTARCLRDCLAEGALSALRAYRQSLGRVILIGLEVLVAATIVKTVTLEPTLQGIGILASMVLVRTLLGWTMVLEMTGRWPWQPKLADREST